MADTILLGLFDNVNQTASAVAELRELGVDDKRVTIMSNVPYSPKIFGRKAPRQLFLPFVLAGALGGVLIGLFIVVGTPTLYPIHVGGQELTPFPPSVIIVGEFLALGAMVGAFIGFLLQAKFPILRRQLYDPRITDGYIGLQVQVRDAQADDVAQALENNGVVDIRREDARDYPPPGNRHLIFWVLAGGGIGTALLVPLLFTFNIIRLPWINVMRDTPAVQYLEGPRRAVPESSIPWQGPVLVADEPATEPLEASEESLQRGELLFSINCSMCHGVGGVGGGPVTKYFPETPPLNGERAQNLTDQRIFWVITNGYNRMPKLAENLTVGETWDVVNYVRSLSAE